MLRLLILIGVLAMPAVALAADAGIDGGVAATQPSARKKRPKTIDFETDTDGPSAGEEVTSRNPKAVKHGSIFPEKYKRPAGAASGPGSDAKRGRGCAGCTGSDGQTSAAALVLVLIAVATRRFR